MEKRVHDIFLREGDLLSPWGVTVQEKEKEENGLMLIVVLLPWSFKGGIRWVHLMTSWVPRFVTIVGFGDPNWSYFMVVEKQ